MWRADTDGASTGLIPMLGDEPKPPSGDAHPALGPSLPGRGVTNLAYGDHAACQPRPAVAVGDAPRICG